MAVPFSNTNLRVPGGFGTILEGLAREVLRHQPEDIPTYAAVYFDGLLKEREESGLDPAEWAARLQDRFYNNRAFQAIPPATEGSSYTLEKSQTENEASGQVSSPPTRQPDGATGDLRESDNQGTEEKLTTEEGVSSGDCGKEEEDEDQTLFTTSNNVDQELIENDIQFSTDKDISQSELDNTNVLLSPSNSMKDVCAEELGAIEHDEETTTQERGTPSADDEVRDTSDIHQSSTDAEKVTEKFPYRLADVDVCAEELQQTEEIDAVKDDLNAHTINGEEIHRDSSLTETHPGDTHELLLSAEDAGHHMQETEKLSDTDAAPQGEALVEINFDDVPELQETVDTQDQQPGDERSVVEQSEQRERSESQLHEDVTGAESVHAEDGAGNTDDPTSETDEQEKEGKVEGEETEDHKVADISMEMDAGDLSMSNVGYEGGLNETMLLGTETAHLEVKTDFDNDDETDNYDASEVENRGNNDPETLNMYDETEDPPEDTIEIEGREIGGEDIEDTQTGLFSEMEYQLPSESYDGGAGIKSNESKPEIEHEEEAEAVAAKENPVELKEIAGASVEPQPEGSMEDTQNAVVLPQTTGAGDQAEEVEIDDEGRGRDDAMGEGSIESYHLSAGRAQDDSNQAEQRLPEAESDVVDPETEDGDKEGECSRPQEEEEDIMDIPLDDPEANKAAAKIQAGFRGHMTRKKMKPEEKAEGEERQEERGQ